MPGSECSKCVKPIKNVEGQGLVGEISCVCDKEDTQRKIKLIDQWLVNILINSKVIVLAHNNNPTKRTF